MTIDAKRWLFGVCLPGVILAGVALTALGLWNHYASQRALEMRQVRIIALADSLRDVVREAGSSEVSRIRALADSRFDAATYGVSPVGSFVWKPKLGIVWSNALASAVGRHISARTRWLDWTNDGRRNVRHGWMREEITDAGKIVPFYFVWGREGNALYALVFNEMPGGSNTCVWIWPVGLSVVLLLGLCLGVGAWQLWRGVEKARRDELVKTSFVSNVSHELKTPLVAMKIWTDMLTSGRIKDASGMAHAITVIASENVRMLRLVNNLLDFSRLERDVRKYCLESLDLVDVAQQVLELLALDLQQQSFKCQIIGAGYALADADALRQILVNLVGNAIKYASSGGEADIVIDTSLPEMVSIAVRDRGPGLSADAQKRVFDRFWREHDELTSSSGGLGLGLSLSRTLACAMNGDLTVSDRLGGGTVFTLSLPHVPA